MNINATKKNTIYVHGCGGAGVNLTNLVVRELSKKYNDVEGFPEWKDLYLDTTDKNIMNLKADMSKFTKVSNNDFGNDADIDGSGGDRASNYVNISDSVPDYLNEHGFNAHKLGEFHIVVCSAGGGSGSVIGPLLSTSLISRGIPTLVIMVGDTFTGTLSRNTKNTIATLSNAAKHINKPITLYYTNNECMKYACRDDRLNATNKRVLSFMTVYSLFLSGQNFDLDNKDIETFLDFTKNATLNSKLTPGLYSIEVLTAEKPHLAEGSEPIIGRTLSKKDVSVNTDYYLVDRKVGQVVHSKVIEDLDGHFPLDLMLTSGSLSKENLLLTEAVTKFDETSANFMPDDLSGSDDATVQDGGMVL